jgi:hypothetical protein
MATTAERSTLRGKIGETIPPGGTAADTLVTDMQLDAWIDGSASMNAAALEGWEFKLAHWAGLVNVSDGASARALSDLMENAQYMIAYFSKQLMGTTRSRSRVGKIVRS